MNAREKAVSYGKLACSISAPRDKRNIHIYLKRDAGCKGALGHQLCDLGLVLWLDAIPKFLAELFHTNEAMLSVREREGNLCRNERCKSRRDIPLDPAYCTCKQ